MNSLVSEQNPMEILTKSYPHVTFKLDQDIDSSIGNMFLGVRQGGIDFSAEIIKLHPFLIKALKVQGKARKKIVDDYVQDYYRDHKVELETSQVTFQDEWNKVEPKFLNITNTVFNEHQWPPGEYNGFPSIFNCNPRWLETKNFQVYRNNIVGTFFSVAHEMLHFIFYDYLGKRHPNYVKQIGEDRLWKLSEVFDELSFEQPEYETFKPKQPSFYPELQPITTMLREKLKGKPFNIESFVTEAKQIKM